MTHEEAINIVKTQYPHDSVIKEALGILIPELRESEDERIRKKIVGGLRLMKEEGKEFFGSEPIDNCISYLEKQEQKPDWSEEDEENLELVIDCIYEYYPDPVKKYKLKDWLKSRRPNKQD